MNIGIFEAVKRLYPGAKLNVDFSLQDDGQGPYIKFWSYESPAPTEAEIQAEITRLQAEYDAKQYQRDRAKEYPDFKDYLDGIVKGDTAQVQAYIDACNAVKAKYPKP
jgi:hypothetical protein